MPAASEQGADMSGQDFVLPNGVKVCGSLRRNKLSLSNIQFQRYMGRDKTLTEEQASFAGYGADEIQSYFMTRAIQSYTHVGRDPIIAAAVGMCQHKAIEARKRQAGMETTAIVQQTGEVVRVTTPESVLEGRHAAFCEALAADLASMDELPPTALPVAPVRPVAGGNGTAVLVEAAE